MEKLNYHLQSPKKELIQAVMVNKINKPLDYLLSAMTMATTEKHLGKCHKFPCPGHSPVQLNQKMV